MLVDRFLIYLCRHYYKLMKLYIIEEISNVDPKFLKLTDYILRTYIEDELFSRIYSCSISWSIKFTLSNISKSLSMDYVHRKNQ